MGKFLKVKTAINLVFLTNLRAIWERITDYTL